MALIDAVTERDKLTLVCDAGHMGLFRSERVLQHYYAPIARFLLARSDPAGR